ncbi:lon protease homolog 2, peroxisomal-like isoform X2 [Bacillus rossius redtenbacheri]|uniref:lon protease homolog 2, peroxisomal-like isoform X2 n=1 Tax=Bacillus rossius redtenbacheri TaxID=93214 RepID=UPI002FDEF97A
MHNSISVPKQIPLILVNDVLLPGSTLKITVTSSSTFSLLKNLLNSHNLASVIVGIVPSDDAETLNKIATAAAVTHVSVTNHPQPSCVLVLTGLCRIAIRRVVSDSPHITAQVQQLDNQVDGDDEDDDPGLQELVEKLRAAVSRLLQMMDPNSSTVSKLKKMLNVLPGSLLADLVASAVPTSRADKLAVLETVDVETRVKLLLRLLGKYTTDAEKGAGPGLRSGAGRVLLQRSPASLHDKRQGASDELAELEENLRRARLPPHADKVARQELERLKRMSQMNPESSVIRSYVELFAELPWDKASSDRLDLKKASADLDSDHYAMKALKKRVLEYLAVRQLKNSLRGPILCFVGPPGVGKTSVGRSIAGILGRQFHRISLGGVCNQSDIRGHRRTYIGAMPGRIIQGLKIAGVNNPVMLLDEIDKLTKGFNGDPAAALLEVLDPEQNCSFVDHYLNVPFDLSQVLFIATANTIKTIPAALLDRMELVHVSGYSQEEKLHIARRHLLPKQILEHGLTGDLLQVPDPVLAGIISGYTREAGVRSLERKLGSLCRAAAVRVVQAKTEPSSVSLPVVIDAAELENILGPAIFLDSELWSRVGQPGVAVGLAWTADGGSVMAVEASKMEGSGELVLTGQLGSVLKESAQLALNWVRTAASQYGIKLDGELLLSLDTHIHFPKGAEGKDGPSAGVTIATALVSLFAERPVLPGVAMTGEITLRGIVLPVVSRSRCVELTLSALGWRCEREGPNSTSCRTFQGHPAQKM